MNLTLACFHCGQLVPSKPNYYFCSKCYTQLKCKQCGEFLEKDDLGCSNCGTPLMQKQSESKAINSIEFEQKGNNKRFVASFTDAVGQDLVASLGGLFLETGAFQKQTQNPFGQSKTSQLLPSANTSTPVRTEGNFEDAVLVDPTNDELNASLVKIFEIEDDKISLINSRLKQTGKRDHAIRITLLLLYAYSLTGKKQVKRRVVVDMLQNVAVCDKNFVFWLSKCDEIKKIDNEVLELNLPGKDAALAVLKEFVNPNIDKGSVQFSALSIKSSRGRSKRVKDEQDINSDSAAQLKSSKSNSKMTPVKMIEILISEGYFKERRRVPEILKYCKENKAHTIANSPLSVALSRMIQSGKMKREKNGADNQYEYFQ